MSEERWLVVRAESELRAGMLIRCDGCVVCGGSHRFFLLRQNEGSCSADPYRLHVGWAVEPPPHRRGQGVCFGHGTLADGRTFRLDTGDAAEKGRREGRESLKQARAHTAKERTR